MADKKEDLVPLVQSTPDFVREIAALLDRHGIRSVTGPLPSKWGSKAWLAVASRDAAASQKLYDDYTHREVDESTRQRADVAANFDADETECPACGTRFKTAGAERCPDCGIAFR